MKRKRQNLLSKGLCGILLSLSVLAASAEVDKELTFPSPNGRWKILATWLDSGHYFGTASVPPLNVH